MSTKQNPVAKHALKFNKAKVFTDRKKALKKGYTKHRINFRSDTRASNCTYKKGG